MKIAHIDKGPMSITFHANQGRDGLFLQWSPYGGEFLVGHNAHSVLRPMGNDKYKHAATEKEARKLAEEFFAEVGEDDE